MIRILICFGLALELFCQNSFAESKTSENYLPIQRVLPIYPEEARSARIEGSCTVIFDVDSRGVVKDNKEIICSPRGYFEEAVDRGISAFRYQPYTFEGVQVELIGMVEIFWFFTEGNSKTSTFVPGVIYNRITNCSSEAKQCVASQERP